MSSLRSRFISAAFVLLFAVLTSTSIRAADPDTLTLSLPIYASGFDSPIFITHAPNDSTRLFVLEREGFIRVIRNDTILPVPYLDITDRVITGGERGLLGMAFHPDYPDSNYIFVNYTGSGGTAGITHISRFTGTANPDVGNPNTEIQLRSITQLQSNHNGGMIAFGSDEMLYIGMGDGGGSGDPGEEGQDTLSLLGAFLRLDVDNPPGYVPSDNPFVGDTTTLDEIWGLGFRNPFRWSFDRVTGDLWIADVGQNVWEEINYEPFPLDAGENYGWDNMEGFACFEPSTDCDTVGMRLPQFSYTHSSGRCSITGGYVYRGCAIPDLDGWYFYGDYCTGEIWRLRPAVDTVEGPVPLFDLSNFNLVSFGEDYYGELYVAEINTGVIRKLTHDGAVEDYCAPPDTGTTCCEGPTGNVNDDPGGDVTLTDLTLLVNHLFVTFAPVPCPAEANTSGDAPCVISLTDLTLLVNNLFVTFEPVADCTDFDPSLCDN